VPGLINLRSDLETEKPELIFAVDRQRAADLGVNPAVVSNFIKTAVFGTKVSTYREFNDEYDIRIRVPEQHRNQLDDIMRMRVPTATGAAVPISSVGRLTYRPGYGNIYRIDRDRVVTVTADAETGYLGTEVLAAAQARLADLDLPSGYHLEYAGEKEEQEESQAFLGTAFLFALLLIVAILVMQFNTLSAPLIIMTTVLLSTIGVFVGLLLFNKPFGIVMTGVGVISLAGVVVNNAIVLLDYTRQLQRRGYELLDAAIEAGVTRLRPVLLTATTTILGLIPMATGFSFDFTDFEFATRSSSSQWWSSMAWAVIFGLGFATVLTLVVVPALYVMLYRVASRFGFGGLEKPEQEHPFGEVVLEDY
jgi:multidrug efflux pump subunit AcrB